MVKHREQVKQFEADREGINILLVVYLDTSTSLCAGSLTLSLLDLSRLYRKQNFFILGRSERTPVFDLKLWEGGV